MPRRLASRLRCPAKADDLERKEAEGRFGKQDFRLCDEDVYVCPAGEKLAYRYNTTEENGLVLRRYWEYQRLPELCNQAHLHHRQGTTG